MAGLREQRRAQRLDLSRRQILDAAEEVFAHKGFHDAAIKEIAARAEFSVGAVYTFFENKDDLFVQIYLRRGGEFMDGMRALLAGDGNATDLLRQLATYQVEFFREHANFGRLFLRASGATLGDLESKIDRAVADNYVEAMNLQAKLFRQGQDTGMLRDGDPDVLARLFTGLVSSYQATDPVVASGSARGTEPMPLADFLEIVDATFRA